MNGSTATSEYTYDANGNLTKDLNKGISSITYNSLNLPQVITFTDGSTITYTYAADGTKLRTVHVISGTTTQTDYCGNVIYESGAQKYLLNEVGYYNLSSSGYFYYLKDHQGNNRVVINSSGTVQETNHYYPFGGLFASTSVQPFKYNGKEFDSKKGLNWYDYGARHYDATLGRWHVVDPLADKYYGYSPYTYCANSPTRFIDPNGEAWRPLYNEDEQGNRDYYGYEWVSDEEAYDKDGNLKEGLYAQAIFFSDNGTFSSSKGYNIGSSTAYVYTVDGVIRTFEACTNPSSNKYATIPEGIYHAVVGKHNSSSGPYTALRMSDINNSGRIELGKPNPAHPNRTYAEGINIHKPGKNNVTGIASGVAMSEGCLLINRNRWEDFIGIFDTVGQRSNKVSVTVSRSKKSPTTHVPIFLKFSYKPLD